MPDLARLLGETGPGLGLRQGVVISAPALNVVTVRLGGSTDPADNVPASYLSAALLTVGTTVWALQTGGILVVLGPVGGTLDTGWLAPSYQNGWVDYGAGGYSPVEYRRRDGITYIEGLAKNGTVNSTIFTLPVGFRPARKIRFVVDSNVGYNYIDIDTGGVVFPAGAAANGWVSLSCSFPADL